MEILLFQKLLIFWNKSSYFLAHFLALPKDKMIQIKIVPFSQSNNLLAFLKATS